MRVKAFAIIVIIGNAIITMNYDARRHRAAVSTSVLLYVSATQASYLLKKLSG